LPAFLGSNYPKTLKKTRPQDEHWRSPPPWMTSILETASAELEKIEH